MEKIDARGLACPAPVIAAKNAVERQSPDALCVVVDNEAARQNVSRFLESRGFAISVEQKGADFHVSGTKSKEPAPQNIPAQKKEEASQKIMIMAATDRFGHGDDVLGQKLMANFLKTLKEMGPDLWRLVFVNAGVKLTIEGSEVLEPLKELEREGVVILVCGTCLTHFSLLDKKRVGETTNMLDIVCAMQLADKVIKI